LNQPYDAHEPTDSEFAGDAPEHLGNDTKASRRADTKSRPGSLMELLSPLDQLT
jgi:hypothetical protein